MKIDDILKKDSIIADLVGTNKGEVLREITDFLQSQGLIKDKEALLDTLIEREKLGSTGIGENVAIPHGKSAELSQIVTVFARSLNGVDFEALDQKPVHFCMHGYSSLKFYRTTFESTGSHIKDFQKPEFARWHSKITKRRSNLFTSSGRRLKVYLIDHERYRRIKGSCNRKSVSA